MAFTNLATKLIQSDIQTHGADGQQQGWGEGFVFHKFAWTVDLQLGTGEAKGLESTGPLVAKTCELPRFSFETQVVNVYNHKTIVQTKMNYEPITMSFYDQVNGTADNLVFGYIKQQFDSTDGSKKAGVLNDMPLTVTITLKNLSGASDAKDKVYTLKNAYIVDVQHDTLDYSTSDPVLWTLTLRYEDLETAEFNTATPKDSAGIAPLPNPPSTPVVGDLPDPPPITQPPKADAKKEVPFDGVTVWEAEGLPMDVYGTQTNTAPEKTTAWPNTRETNSAWDGNADDPEAQVFVPPYNQTTKPVSNVSPAAQQAASANDPYNASDPEAQAFIPPYNASTGNPSAKIQSGVTAQQAAEARAAYARTDPRRLDSEGGVNQKFKESYANNYAKEIARIPPNASPQTKARMERQAANIADLKARVDSPKYTAQIRTQNADGSFTDRAVLQPQSVNNNPPASATQATREQSYNNSAPTNRLDAALERSDAKRAGMSVEQYRAQQSQQAQDRAARMRKNSIPLD